MLIFLVFLMFLQFIGIYFICSAPLIKKERNLQFIQILETCVRYGHNIEEEMVKIYRMGKNPFGMGFSNFIFYIRDAKLGFVEALKRERRFLTQKVGNLLLVAAENGQMTKVLPACVQILNEDCEKAKHKRNMIYFGFHGLVVYLCVLPFIAYSIYPKFLRIFQDLTESAPIEMEFLFLKILSFPGVTELYIVITIFLIIYFICYIGPELFMFFMSWSGFIPGLILKFSNQEMPFTIRNYPLKSYLEWVLPWSRLRVLRNFFMMLSTFLDSETPEGEALEKAAKATGSSVLIKKARKACLQLEEGQDLLTVIQFFYKSKELNWRLNSGRFRKGGVEQALDSFVEKLNVKALEIENVFVQLLTNFLILINGLAIGIVGYDFFNFLTTSISIAQIW